MFICNRHRFPTLEAAKAYAERLFAQRGIIAGIEKRQG